MAHAAAHTGCGQPRGRWRSSNLILAGAPAVQVDFSSLSAIIVIKKLGRAFQAVRDKGVPIIWVCPSICGNPLLPRLSRQGLYPWHAMQTLALTHAPPHGPDL